MKKMEEGRRKNMK